MNDNVARSSRVRKIRGYGQETITYVRASSGYKTGASKVATSKVEVAKEPTFSRQKSSHKKSSCVLAKGESSKVASSSLFGDFCKSSEVASENEGKKSSKVATFFTDRWLESNELAIKKKATLTER